MCEGTTGRPGLAPCLFGVQFDKLLLPAVQEWCLQYRGYIMDKDDLNKRWKHGLVGLEEKRHQGKDTVVTQ